MRTFFSVGRRLSVASVFILVAAFFVPHKTTVADAPVHTVTWDSHSLMVDGKRVLLYSGEFHYWRLPSQSLWLDRLQKMKAAGLNAVSIYFSWQYHSSAQGQYDFAGVRDVDALLRMTDRLGLYVIARAGPYMNAEADAGGLPGWLLSKPLLPRSQSWNGQAVSGVYSPLYAQYSREWYDHILPILARHQVTNGGSVILFSIENEYSQPQASSQYMRELYSDARADGINVPIFHNDFYFRGDWKGLVDLYAYDSYPYGFRCCPAYYDNLFHGVDTWESTLRSQLKVKTPMFVSELQGGSFDPWGGAGYDRIAKTLNDRFRLLMDESALAQGASIFNTYMFVGGTTWGYMGEPGVYTSYDYGAPVSESGILRPSYYAAHRLAMFLQAYGPELAGATPTTLSATNKNVVVHARTDGASGQQFIFARNGNPTGTQATRLKLRVAGHSYTVPQRKGWTITLPPQSADLLTGNTQVGPLLMNYSTSQVLTDASTASGHYLVLYGPQGAEGETDFREPKGGIKVSGAKGVLLAQKSGHVRLDYRYGKAPQNVQLKVGAQTLHLLVMTDSAASRTWLVDNTLVSGPDIAYDFGSGLRVGLSKTTTVQVYGASASARVALSRFSERRNSHRSRGLDTAQLSGPTRVALPSLGAWKFQSASPETDRSYDDSGWTLANHTSTNNPNVPASSTLLADDYGFHYGFVWYRGHFTAAGTETAITVSARQSYSVYLNGTYLGSGDTSLADPPHTNSNPYFAPKKFAFPGGVLRPGQDNVVAVLTESLGHDEGWTAGPLAQSPQGLVAAQLTGSSVPIAWRLQGAAGGEQPGDPERGPMNASGLFGERLGWYLPSYDDASWQPVTMPDNWNARGVSPAVGWYRTSFRLGVPADTQEPLGLTLPHVSDKAVIWLNGWLIGRYWEQRGPQHTFYLPPGVLNTNGDNSLSIAVWNRGHAGGITSVPSLTAYGALRLVNLPLR